MHTSCRRATKGSFLAVGILLISACDDPASVCPGEWSEAVDPLITIQSAVNATDRAPISQLTLSEIHYLGQPQGAEDIEFYLNSNAQNMTGDGDRLVCSVPCGFAAQEGPWEFTLSSPGYVPERISLDASYSGTERIDECKLKFIDGPVLDIELEPVA